MTNVNVEKVKTRTVDSQQGKQAKYILLDMTASKLRRSPFFLSRERPKVALTRAKSGLLIVGDEGTVQDVEK